MKKAFTALAALALATTATAADRPGDTPKHRGFDGQLSQVAGPIALDVTLGEDLVYLADNPGRPNGSISRLRDGFGTGGFLGEKDLEELRADVEEELVQRFTKRGIAIDPDAATVLRVRVVDAQPNRPTFKQLSVEPSLSFRSFGRGGASLEGELIQAGGQELGNFTYGYYTHFIEEAQFRGTWTDANRAIDLFAKKVAKKLT